MKIPLGLAVVGAIALSPARCKPSGTPPTEPPTGLAAGLYSLRTSSGCLDVDNLFILFVPSCKPDGTQRFKFTSKGELRPIWDNWCADIVSNLPLRAFLAPCNGTPSQQFVFSGGAFRSPSTGYCLQPESSLAGSTIRVEKCDGSAAQRWNPQATPMILEGSATPIPEISFSGFPPGVPHTIATTEVSGSSDPVLHVLERADAGAWRQVAMDDNGAGGRAAQVTFTPQSGVEYVVVLRAAGNDSAGTCSLTVDGTRWKSPVSFGGFFAVLPDVRPQETIHTVHRRGSSQRPPHIAYALEGASGGIRMRIAGEGVAGGISFSASSLGPQGPQWIAVGVPDGSPASALRLLRNDAAIHDFDRDGLGSELEDQLGTCDTPGGTTTHEAPAFDCQQASDPRDTDGDGLRDLWEVFGRPFKDDDQPLPAWGADPRHKDMFIEVDFQQHCSPRPGLPCEPEPHMMMTRDDAREFSRTYGDEMNRTPPEIKKANAAILHNPDGKPGIATHLDIGQDPDPTSETFQTDLVRFGNWGGHNLIPWDHDAGFPTNMRPARYGVFRYGHGFNGCESQTPTGYACSLPMQPGCGGTVGAHECGHANDLKHEGIGGSAGNCKPTYVNIMNYAYMRQHEIGFSDVGNLAPASLNNTRLPEWQPGYSLTFQELLRDGYGYGYWVRDDGSVDWNRDGEIAPAGTLVRAYANSLENVDCEFTQSNAMSLDWSAPPAEGAVRKSVALARLGGRVYVFQEVAGQIGYKTTADLNCPNLANPCPPFGEEKRLAGLDGVTGFDLLRLPSDAARALMVYARGTELRQGFLSLNGDSLVLSDPVVVAGDATNEPSLAAWGGRIFLSYRATDGMLHFSATSGTRFTTVTATAIPLAERTSPAMVAANLDGPGTPYRLFGAFAAPSRLNKYAGLFRLYELNGDSWAANSADLLIGLDAGRPAMAWMPPQAEAGLPSGFPPQGRLYILTLDATSDGSPGRVMVQYSIKKNDQGPLIIGQRQSLVNTWSYGLGVAAMFEPGIDMNLRVAQVHPNTTALKGVTMIRPLGDGIVDLDQTRGNGDWPTLRAQLCHQLVAQAPLDGLTSQLVCP